MEQEKIVKPSAKHLVEYIGMRLVGGLLFLLPQPVTRGLAWVTARIMFHGIRYRRDEAQRRICSVLNCTPAHARKIAWNSLYHLCLMSVDSLRMSARRTRKLRHQPAGQTFEKMYAAHQARFNQTGMIIAFPHMGCWEQTGLAGFNEEFDQFFMAKRQKNPLADAYINRKRSLCGTPAVLNDSKALRTVIRKLKSGSMMLILPDISEKSREAMQINFLGGTANVNAGTVMFARTTGAPIYPACPVFKNGQHHLLCTGQPILADPSLPKEEDYQRMMQQLFDFYDEQIRRHPEQYFWYNKRWILAPINT